MNRTIFPRRLLPVGMAVAILLMGASSVQAPALVHAPLAETLGYSYSVAANGPSAARGCHPADIRGAGGMVLIPCANLGLSCDDPVGGGSDDLAAPVHIPLAGVEDRHCRRSGEDDVWVEAHRRHVAGLLRAEKIAGAADLEIAQGNLEALSLIHI